MLSTNTSASCAPNAASKLPSNLLHQLVGLLSVPRKHVYCISTRSVISRCCSTACCWAGLDVCLHGLRWETSTFIHRSAKLQKYWAQFLDNSDKYERCLVAALVFLSKQVALNDITTKRRAVCRKRAVPHLFSFMVFSLCSGIQF